MSAFPSPATIRSIFHPSDFSDSSSVAFQHALRLALAAKAGITVLHVANRDGASWSEFPGVRHWLERWRMIRPGSGREAVTELGLAVNKVLAHSNDTLRATMQYIERHPAELVVLGGVQHTVPAVPNVAPPPASPRSSSAPKMTLFLPDGARGFIDAESGSILLRSILVPVSRTANAQLSVDAAVRFADSLGLTDAVFHVLHVGARETMPAMQFPARAGWSWFCDVQPGEVVSGILGAAETFSSDLIAIATRGGRGFLDALHGSTSEEIIRRARRAVLAIQA